MESRKYLLGLICITLVAVMTIFLTNPGPIGAQEQCKLVTISGQAGPDISIRIEPETLVISKGDCVVWINWVRAAKIRVNFREGKKCTEATKAPSGFKFETGCYLTDFIALGGTSSLRFVQEGAYDYEIEVPGARYPMKGTIMVKK